MVSHTNIRTGPMKTMVSRAMLVLLMAPLMASVAAGCSGGTSGGTGTGTGTGTGNGSSGDGGTGNGNPPVASDGTGANCMANKDCTAKDALCLVHDGASVGYCSRPCSGGSDCPSDFYCARAGNVSHLYCILESSLVDDCNKDCDDYNVAGCLSAEGLTKCRAACSAAKPTDQFAFDGCATTSIVMCQTACIDTLCKASNTTCGDVTASTCMRSSTLDPECKGMGLPAAGYDCKPGTTPNDSSCKSLPLPDSYCCSK